MYDQFLHIIRRMHIGSHCQHIVQLLVRTHLSEQTLLLSRSLSKAKSLALFLSQAISFFFFSVMTPCGSTERAYLGRRNSIALKECQENEIQTLYLYALRNIKCL